MIITARYASTCPGCGAPITAGSKVDWARGRPARHVTCAAVTCAATSGVVATSRPAARRPRRGARFCEGWGADNPHAPRPPYTCDQCEDD
jgi:hypothetical protein